MFNITTILFPTKRSPAKTLGSFPDLPFGVYLIIGPRLQKSPVSIMVSSESFLEDLTTFELLAFKTLWRHVYGDVAVEHSLSRGCIVGSGNDGTLALLPHERLYQSSRWWLVTDNREKVGFLLTLIASILLGEYGFWVPFRRPDVTDYLPKLLYVCELANPKFKGTVATPTDIAKRAEVLDLTCGIL